MSLKVLFRFSKAPFRRTAKLPLWMLVFPLLFSFLTIPGAAGATAAPTTSILEVDADSDIVLAGKPDGTSIKSLRFSNRSDRAVVNSPVEAELGLVAGQAVQFTAVSGSVNVPNHGNNIGPNGSSFYAPVDTGEAFGLSSVRGPIGALVGVFLGGGASGAVAPPFWDFSGGERELAVIAPKLQQPFYIGTGKNSAGVTKSFIVPQNAARLFLGVLDYQGENSDNTGSFAVLAVVTNAPPSNTWQGGNIRRG